MSRVALVAALAVAIAGCSDEPDPTRSTEGRDPTTLTLSIAAASNGEQTLVTADVLAGNQHLELAGGDRLVARVGAVEAELVRVGARHVAFVAAASPTIVTAFVRGTSEARATLTLPADFGIVGPTTVPRRDPLSLAFEPDPELATDLVLYGDCVRTVRRRVAKGLDGYGFDPADLFLTKAAGCFAGVRATRAANDGVAVEGLAAARVSLTQERTWTFRIVP